MLTTIKNFFFLFRDKNFKNTEKYYNALKVVLLGASFFFIIASYSTLRPLKTSVFFALVGKEYAPIAKMISILILFPIMLPYSKLVDKLRQSQVIYFFLGLYAILCIIFAFFFWHPTIGLSNTNTSTYRIIGWVFYLALDLFSTLVVSTFWAFANSISTPNNAKENYGIIVAISRVGGIISPIISWLLMQKLTQKETLSIPVLMVLMSLFLLLACFFISRIIKKIPHKLLHGYEAAYKIEKQQKKVKVGLFQGLKLMITQPYVFGIFGIICSYELISIILDYQMQVLMSVANNNTVLGMSSFMLLYTAAFQGLGFIFALFGTSSLLKLIGVRKCLFIMPISIIVLMLMLLTYPNITTIFIIMVVLRALNYGFNAPVKEILYIPTTKDVKFKSKAWIESFGRSLSKTSGSTFNWLAQFKDTVSVIRLDSLYAIGISAVWLIISFFVGKKYDKVIKNNTVIGQEDL
ncbi:MAG: Npt1/Npt2 family nucleotide transporter [Candidatus Babeliales bacterium]